MGTSSQLQPTWYFNSAAANNRDTGLDAAHPLRDLEELHRRLGRGTWVFKQPTTITIAGSYASTDPLYMPAAYSGDAGQLTIQGAAATVLATGTISTFTAFNAGSQALDTITVAWTTGGSSFAPYIGKFMRVTSGPRAGVTWLISRDLLSNTAEITSPGISAPLTGGLQLAYGFTRTVPVATDPFEIVSLPSAYCGELNFGAATTIATGSSVSRVLLTGLALHWTTVTHTIDNFNAPGVTGGAVVVNASNCELSCFTSNVAQQFRGIQNAFPDGCALIGQNVAMQANLHHRAGGTAAHHFILSSAIAVISQGELLEGAALTVSGGGRTSLTSMRQFRDSGFGVNLQTGANVTFGSDVWGTGNPGPGIIINSMSRAQYTSGSPPTINAGLGIGREVRLGDRDVLYADLPMTSRGASMEFSAV